MKIFTDKEKLAYFAKRRGELVVKLDLISKQLMKDRDDSYASQMAYADLLSKQATLEAYLRITESNIKRILTMASKTA